MVDLVSPEVRAQKEDARWAELIRPLADKRLVLLSQMNQITRAVSKANGWTKSGYLPDQYETIRTNYKEVDDQIKVLQEAAATGADPIMYKLQGKQEDDDGTENNTSPY